MHYGKKEYKQVMEKLFQGGVSSDEKKTETSSRRPTQCTSKSLVHFDV